MDKKFFTLGPDGVRKTFSFNQAIGAAVPTEKEGCYLIAGTDGLYLQDTESDASTLLTNLKDYYESYQRSNDAKADPAGLLFFGSSVVAVLTISAVTVVITIAGALL